MQNHREGIIWATDFTESVTTATSGGKGGGPRVTTTDYSYAASFAVALCEGEISGIGRIWADSEPMDLSGVTYRIHTGRETQSADPLIEALNGAAPTPAYRGTAYVVFEDLPLADYGNRIPQLSFEVFRPLDEDDNAEGQVRALCMIPGAGEFAYATQVITSGGSGVGTVENAHATGTSADMPPLGDACIACRSAGVA